MNYQARIRSKNNYLHNVSVISFSSQNDAFNSDYCITIALNLSHYLPAEQLLLENACLCLQYGDLQRCWHGCFSQVDVIGKNAEGYGYKLLLSSPWYLLKRQAKNRVYVDETLTSLVTKVFADYPVLLNKLKICLNTDYLIDYAAQYQETDYALLNRWFIYFGIITKVEQSNNHVQLVITDQHQHVTTKKLGFITNSGLIAESSRVLEWQQHDFLLSKQLDWQRRLFKAKTDDVSLKVDDVFLLTNHPSHNAQQPMRVCLNNHIFGQGSYHNQLLLCEAEKNYAKPCHLTQLPKVYRQLINYDAAEVFGGTPRTNQHPIAASSVLSAIIDAPAKEIKLDGSGCYRVKFDFAENHYPQGCNSPPLKLIKATAGEQWGMHWPLHGQTKVAIGHIDGDLDRPFILGVLPDQATPGPVTQRNPLQTILHSHRQAGVLFDDAKTSVLQFATAQQQQVIRFSHGDQGSRLQLTAHKGLISLRAAQAMDYWSAKAFVLDSADITVNVTLNSEVVSHHGRLLYQSGDAMNFQAGQFLQMESKHDLLLRSASDINCSADGHISLQTLQGNIQLQAQNRAIFMQAANTATLASQNGAMVLSAGSAQCKMLPDGTTTLSGENLYFCAKSIKLPENSHINSV